MFTLAIALGIFSYIIFFLGLSGILYSPVVIVVTLLFWGIFLIFYQKKIISYFNFPSSKSLIFYISISLLFFQALVNSIGLLGPEIGFDALWYHLTLPKLYLQYHTIFHIPGGVFFYSDMPKLTEMLYTAGLAFSSDIFARGIHYIFGILCCVALYKVARKFFSPTLAILAPVIFYSNLVVGWESISAYIDLSRTFFEIMTLWGFLNWVETKQKKDFILFSLMAGFTFTTKLLAGGSILLYACAIFLIEVNSNNLWGKVKAIGIYLSIALLVPLPWLLFAYVHTGNPFYPLFNDIVPAIGFWEIIKPQFLIATLWNTFAQASDPIHPIYLLSIPFFFLYRKELMSKNSLLIKLTLGGLLVWYITPQTGGGRYILPYLTLFTLSLLFLITVLPENWKKVFIVSILFFSVISIGFRFFANTKFFPVILGKESQAAFLSKHLQFSLGDFYDIDGYFTHHIKPTDKVLLYGFHNLYYIDFPYVHDSWVQKGDAFNYVAVQGKGMPERFRYWNLIYFNSTTQVRLYSLPGTVWQYY